MMKHVWPASNAEETKKINEFLGVNYDHYDVSDILNILPQEIEYRGKKGYIRISPIDITYGSLESDAQMSPVALFGCLTDDKNLFTAFYDALKWFEEHAKDVKVF